jgi:hypothetical protein
MKAKAGRRGEGGRSPGPRRPPAPERPAASPAPSSPLASHRGSARPAEHRLLGPRAPPVAPGPRVDSHCDPESPLAPAARSVVRSAAPSDPPRPSLGDPSPAPPRPARSPPDPGDPRPEVQGESCARVPDRIAPACRTARWAAGPGRLRPRDPVYPRPSGRVPPCPQGPARDRAHPRPRSRPLVQPCLPDPPGPVGRCPRPAEPEPAGPAPPGRSAPRPSVTGSPRVESRWRPRRPIPRADRPTCLRGARRWRRGRAEQEPGWAPPAPGGPDAGSRTAQLAAPDEALAGPSSRCAPSRRPRWCPTRVGREVPGDLVGDAQGGGWGRSFGPRMLPRVAPRGGRRAQPIGAGALPRRLSTSWAGPIPPAAVEG